MHTCCNRMTACHQVCNSCFIFIISDEKPGAEAKRGAKKGTMHGAVLVAV